MTEEKLYSLREFDEMIKKHKASFEYTLADAILLLLYADKNPIKGKIRQMKEVFFMLKEVLHKVNVQPVEFKKKRYGPHSEEVEFTIDGLVFSNFVKVSGKKATNDFAIEITEKGREYTKNKFQELPKDVQETVKRRRRI